MNFYYGPTVKKPSNALGWMYVMCAVTGAYHLYSRDEFASMYAGLVALGVFWAYRNFRDAGKRNSVA